MSTEEDNLIFEMYFCYPDSVNCVICLFVNEFTTNLNFNDNAMLQRSTYGVDELNQGRYMLRSAGRIMHISILVHYKQTNFT